MTVATYKWTIDRYHQAIQAGVFDEQPVNYYAGNSSLRPQRMNPMLITTEKQVTTFEPYSARVRK